MNALPLALSISNSFTKVGAIAAFAGLVGIALLALLVFSQAREIKRLREWAGRAPERAAEMEQRVSADAAARLQRGPAQPAVPGGRVPAAARVVPRKTPLVSAPVSTAVNATASAAVPAAAASPPAATPALDPSALPAAQAQAAAPAASAGVPGAGAPPESPAPADGVPAGSEPGLAQGEVPVSSGAPGDVPAPASSPVPTDPSRAPDADAPAPATAAAVARAPLPPSPAAPAPPGAPAVGQAQDDPAPVPPAQKPPVRPSAPVAAARRTPSRTVAVAGAGFPPRSPAPSRGRSSRAATSDEPSSSAGLPAGAGGPKYFKQERSPARAMVLVVGAVIVVVLALVFAVSALKGGGNSPSPSPHAQTVSSEAPSSAQSHGSTQAASNPAETTVTVLNGTGTAGLAHHLASDLQQSGYSQAAASAAVPQGTHSTTVVEYTSGHRTAAQAVARSLNVTQVQPMDSATAALAGSASVVVLAGADQAALLGGGSAQSQGEPAAVP